jgi:hypothetical protein
MSDIHDGVPIERLVRLAGSVGARGIAAKYQAEVIRRLKLSRDLVEKSKAAFMLIYEQLDNMDDESAEDVMNELQESIDKVKHLLESEKDSRDDSDLWMEKVANKGKYNE